MQSETRLKVAKILAMQRRIDLRHKMDTADDLSQDEYWDMLPPESQELMLLRADSVIAAVCLAKERG